MNAIDIFALYRTEQPVRYEMIDSSRGEDDFRQTFIAEWKDEKLAVKVVRNEFSTPQRIAGWREAIRAYIDAGYYCPQIVKNRNGNITETVEYEGKECVVFAEEYAKYPLAQTRAEHESGKRPDGRHPFHDEAVMSIGVIGAKRLTCAEHPSGLCILEKHVPSDPCDEVMENALEFREIMEKELPQYRERFERIWARFEENMQVLKAVYPQFTWSVFQGDLNGTNLMTDEQGKFAGILDFNLCGRDTVLNILFRESLINYNETARDNEVFFSEEADAKAIQSLLENTRIVRRAYAFTGVERENVYLLYRYLRPFWWTPLMTLKWWKDKNEPEKIAQILDWIERQQTRTDIDFAGAMK